MSTLFVEATLIGHNCDSESHEINKILDRDLDILVPHERTIKLWMRVFGNDPNYDCCRRVLLGLTENTQQLSLAY